MTNKKNESYVTKLKEVERAMVRLQNKQNRADLDYTVQISIDSTRPSVIHWTAQMSPLAISLRPATFISLKGPEDLIKQIKDFTDNLDDKMLEIAYHKSQIHAAGLTIQGHEEAIKSLEEEDKEEPQEEDIEESNNKE